MLRIGTLIFMGPPLEFLPYHRSDRFPRSGQEPGSSSRYLYAGRHPSSRQVTLGLILESHKPPVLASSFSFRHLSGSSLALASLNLTWHGLLPCLFLPGRPVEFHHQSPSDPYVSLSTHTARASLPPEAFQSQAYLARKSSSQFPG